jgi:AmpD protein
MHETLSIDANTGLLIGARQVLSPHADERPPGVPPALLVVHGISLPPGEFGGPWIDRLFCGNLGGNLGGNLTAGSNLTGGDNSQPDFSAIAGLRVSAHAVIRRGGEISQYVPFGARAWHAGESSYQGHAACNDYSIGIELEGTDLLAYTDAQYDSLAQLIRALCAAYPTLSTARLVGHSDIAPGRKTDPGAAFDWPRLRAMLA